MVKGKGKTARVSASSKPAPRGAPSGTSAAKPRARSGGGSASAPGGEVGGFTESDRSLLLDHCAPGLGKTPAASFMGSRTRLALEAVRARFGTPEEVHGALRRALRASFVAEGKTEKDFDPAAPFPEEHVLDLLFAPENRGKFFAKPTRSRYNMAYANYSGTRADIARRIGETLGDADGTAVLNAYASYADAHDPHAAVFRNPFAFNPRSNAYSELLSDLVGVNGRIVPPEKAAKKHGMGVPLLWKMVADFEKHSGGYSLEMMRWAASESSGRRYLWPDERSAAGRRRGNA